VILPVAPQSFGKGSLTISPFNIIYILLSWNANEENANVYVTSVAKM
jgi:hypothetical protein